MSPRAETSVPDAIRLIANAEDRRLAWEFFVFFSRFEYALKRNQQYLMPGTGPAEPNWDRFASKHANAFTEHATKRVTAAIAFYRAHPPRKQLRENGEMKWSEPFAYDEREVLLLWLLRAIRVVRNNLFHGGKFPLLPISDPSRDRDLLAHAMTVLDSALKLDIGVYAQFLDGLDE